MSERTRKLAGNLLFFSALVTCPCHLLWIMALVAGTALGGILSRHWALIWIASALYFAVALPLSLKLLRSFNWRPEQKAQHKEKVKMYRPISDYAIIGDTQTAALISSHGSIDWLCFPYFDSPALFLRLLDDAQGGYCSVEPRQLKQISRRYLPRTAILETRFETASGVLVLTDFMPIRKRREPHSTGDDVVAEHRLVRILTCAEGEGEFSITIKPTFSFATERAEIVESARGVALMGSQDYLHAQAPFPLQEQDGQIFAVARLRRGESAPLVLTHIAPGQRCHCLAPEEVAEALARTRAYWEEWSDSCSYPGQYRDLVLRSAITLKLLTFEPTGAIVAAPTTSLPEEIGGVRNWDYRFTWLRDATFTLTALMNIGYLGEAHDFLHFIHRACSGPASDFKILYSIHGQAQAEEKVLPHLAGYRGSKPVRTGNGAAGQRQLDIYGELLDSMYLFANYQGFDKFQERIAESWPMMRSVADHVVRNWRKPDAGIWEVRSGDRHFVHSKALCWVALDRACKLAEIAGLRPNPRWTRERQRIYDSLLNEGYSAAVGAFVQSYGSTALDASVLRLPLLGVIEATDPRMRSTIHQIEQRLVRNHLVYRYLAEDGLPSGEGTFTICALWLIQNYVLQGRLAEAEELLQQVLSFGSDLGLFAEEIDPVTGEQLGNFPQAFTHIALINTAVRLAAAQQNRKTIPHTIVEQQTPSGTAA